MPGPYQPSRARPPTELWVALQAGSAVAVLDAATGKMLHRIPVPKGPTYIKVSPDGRWVAVTSSAADSVTLIDAESARIDPGAARLVRTLPAPGGPFTVSVRVIRKDGTILGPRSGAAS